MSRRHMWFAPDATPIGTTSWSNRAHSATFASLVPVEIVPCPRRIGALALPSLEHEGILDIAVAAQTCASRIELVGTGRESMHGDVMRAGWDGR